MAKHKTERSERFVPCFEIVKSLNCIRPKDSTKAIEKPIELNQEQQLDFAGPRLIAKKLECNLLVFVEQFLRHPSSEVLRKPSRINLTKFLKLYMNIAHFQLR